VATGPSSYPGELSDRQGEVVSGICHSRSSPAARLACFGSGRDGACAGFGWRRALSKGLNFPRDTEDLGDRAAGGALPSRRRAGSPDRACRARRTKHTRHRWPARAFPLSPSMTFWAARSVRRGVGPLLGPGRSGKTRHPEMAGRRLPLGHPSAIPRDGSLTPAQDSSRVAIDVDPLSEADTRTRRSATPASHGQKPEGVFPFSLFWREGGFRRRREQHPARELGRHPRTGPPRDASKPVDRFIRGTVRGPRRTVAGMPGRRCTGAGGT